MRIPIGDPITTELIAKLPWKIMNRKEIKKLPKKEQQALKRNLQEIENVRLFSATWNGCFIALSGKEEPLFKGSY